MSENLHEGHRDRLRKKFEDRGIKKLEPHEQLELLLFYVFPRINTNDIAHRLINRFGSVSAIFSAPLEELKNVKGMGDKSALHLYYLGRFFNNLQTDTEEEFIFTTTDSIAEHSRKLIPNFNIEYILFLLFDKKKKLVSVLDMTNDLKSSANLNTRELLKRIINTSCDSFVMVHNHTNGSLIPSSSDLNLTRSVYNCLKGANVNFNDHLIIDANDYYSIRAKNLLPDIW